MITQTIREVLANQDAPIRGWVYVIRDGEVIFYVGISNDPASRLCQHLGIAHRHTMLIPPLALIACMETNRDERLKACYLWASQTGRAVLDNAPESLDWSFDIYETEDAIAAMKDTPYVVFAPDLLETMKLNWYEQKEIVERVLIMKLKPYLNTQMNEHQRMLPSCYRVDGQDLDDNAVDYIKL